MTKITEKFLTDMLSETLENLGENFYKGYGDKANFGLPNLNGGEAGGLGDGNKFHMPSGKGQGSGQDQENQGTPAKPTYGNQENAKAASNAGPKNDTFSHEAKEDPTSSEKVSLKVAGDVDALPKDIANKFEDPGTKENKRGKSMKKLKGGVKKLPKSVAEAKALINRLKKTIALFEANVQLYGYNDVQIEDMATDLPDKADAVPAGEPQTYTVDTAEVAIGTYGFALSPDGVLEETPNDEYTEYRNSEAGGFDSEARENDFGSYDVDTPPEHLEEAVIAYDKKSKKFGVVTLTELKAGKYNKDHDLYAYEQDEKSIRLTERVN